MSELLSDEAPESMRGASRVLVVGGGRGGVGKSLLAVNLAVYFAQLGRKVVLVDADVTGSNLHAHFGLPAAVSEPPLDTPDLGSMEKALVQTEVFGLELLAAAHDSSTSPHGSRAVSRSKWLHRLRALPREVIVIDAGPGQSPFAIDLFLSADSQIAVTTPEPTAVETTYRFLRAAYRRKLRRSLLRDRYRLGLFERALVELGHLPSPLLLVNKLASMDKVLAETAWAEAERLAVSLVVNQTRIRSDAELGSYMSVLAERHYGVHIEPLGHIEYDDVVWLTARRRRPLLIDSPTCKAARTIERVARRLLSLRTGREPKVRTASLPEDELSLYAMLGVSRTASDEEIRRAYKRQKEIYAPGGAATASLLSALELSSMLGKLDLAHDTLLDTVRRKAYDLSTFPEAAPDKPVEPFSVAPVEKLLLRKEVEESLGPDTEYSGELLRKIRESLGIEIVDVSLSTKVTKAHLLALEAEDYAALPAQVYTRGFLMEFAKALGLDPERVNKTYLRRMRARVGGGHEAP